MKLFKKTTRLFVATGIVAVILGGIISFFLLNFIMDEESREHLQIMKQEIESYVKKNNSLPENEIFFSDTYTISPASSPIKEVIKDTSIYDSLEEEILPYREFHFGISANGKPYEVVILKPLYEKEDLMEVLLLAFVLIALLMSLAAFLMNYFYSRKLWTPFYAILKELRSFEISRPATLNFTQTDIFEFNTLQDNLHQLTGRIQKEFQSLKSFTENASHEIQTPLAVLRSNLELLIQDENLQENQLMLINDLLDSVSKLTRLNKTLLLLVKIENRQINKPETVDISTTLELKLKTFEPVFEEKEIRLEISAKPGIKISTDPYLFDLLLNNLIGNALKYTQSGETIQVTLGPGGLQFINPGKAFTKTPERLFERFEKENESSDSLGLGLSLVKEICDVCGFKISYSFDFNKHVFSVSF